MHNLIKMVQKNLFTNRNRSTYFEIKLIVIKRELGGGKLGIGDYRIHTTIHKIGNYQGPTV